MKVPRTLQNWTYSISVNTLFQGFHDENQTNINTFLWIHFLLQACSQNHERI